jgi:hypothetical protein
MRRHKRLRAEYGEPFSEHGKIVHSVVNRVREDLSPYFRLEGVKRLYQHETNFLICAEMEKILRGRVSPATESDMDELRQEMARLIAEEEERLRRDEAGREEARRKRDGEEEARLKQEAREAARLKRKTDERARPARPKYGSPKPYDESVGMHVFDLEEYERQIASGKHPSGQVPRHLRRD